MRALPGRVALHLTAVVGLAWIGVPAARAQIAFSDGMGELPTPWSALATTGCGTCMMEIERAMRDIQGRRKLFKGDYFQWPDSTCGDDGSVRKAPPFPPDGFYRNELCDPRRAAQLVEALQDAIVVNPNLAGLASEFFNPPPQTPTQGQTKLDNLMEGHPFTVPGFGGLFEDTHITQENYCEEFQKIRLGLSLLAYVPVTNRLPDGVNSPEVWMRDGDEQTTQEQCLSPVEICPGPYPPGYWPDPDTWFCAVNPMAAFGLVPPRAQAKLDASPWTQVSFSEVGVREWYGYAEDCCFNLVGEKVWTCMSWAYISQTIATMHASAPSARGPGRVFIRLDLPNAPGTPVRQTNDPPLPLDAKFHSWGTFNQPANWVRGLSYPPPEFTTLDETTVRPSGEIGGWQVTPEGPGNPSRVEVMRPNFERRPDTAASTSCSSCEPGKLVVSGPGVNVKIGLGSGFGGDAGYLLIRGDTIVGWGDEILVRNLGGLHAGSGADELGSIGHLGVFPGAWYSISGNYRVPHPSTQDPLEQFRFPQGLVKVLADTPADPTVRGQYLIQVWVGLYEWNPTTSHWVAVVDPVTQQAPILVNEIRVQHSMEDPVDDPNDPDPEQLLVTGHLKIAQREDLQLPFDEFADFSQSIKVRDWTELVQDPENGNPIPRGHLPSTTTWIGTDSWTLSSPTRQGPAARTESITNTWAGGYRKERRTARDGNGAVIADVEDWYQRFPWVPAGWDSPIPEDMLQEELVKRVVDPDGAALTTTIEYYTDDPTSARFSHVKQVTEPTGYWQRFIYEEGGDNRGKLKKVVSQFKGRPYSEEQNRVTEYSYHSVTLNNESGNGKERIVEEVERFEGKELSRQFTIYWRSDDEGGGPPTIPPPPPPPLESGDFRETSIVRCKLPGPVSNVTTFLQSTMADPHSQSDALVTHRRVRRLSSGAPTPLAGRVVNTLEPDGTVTFIEFPVIGGPLNAYGFIENGWATVTQRGPKDPGAPPFCPVGAELFPRDGTRSITAKSMIGTVLLQQSFDMQGTFATMSGSGGGTWEDDVKLSQSTVTQRDLSGRATVTQYLDGTQTSVSYGCCGIDQTTDRSGLVTKNWYDEFGRLEQTDHAFGTPAQLSTKYTFDPEGRVRATKRVGSDASQMLQSTVHYDLAGRMDWSEDGLGNRTTFSESIDLVNAQVTRTTTLPDPDGAGPLASPTQVTVSYPDGATLSEGGTASAPVQYDYGVEEDTVLGSGVYVAFTKSILVGDGGALTEWTKSYTDPLGRSYRTVYADAVESRSYYNSKGELAMQVDPDGVTVRHRSGYGLEPGLPTGVDWVGAWQLTAIDLDRQSNETVDHIDFGVDRITQTKRQAVASVTDPESVATAAMKSTTRVWTTPSDQTTTVLQGTSYTALGYPGLVGTRSWSDAFGLVSHSKTEIDAANRTTTSTTFNPDGTSAVSISVNGRQTSVTSRFAGGTTTHTQSTTAYDAHGRVQSVTDTRGTVSTADDRTTTFAYDSLDRQYQITSPDPDGAGSQSPQVTTLTFDNLGRVTQTQLPDGGLVHTEYFPTGAVKKTWGARVYPTEYTYDTQGRTKTLTTWQDFNESSGTGTSGSATTTWNYSSTRGWMTGKLYHGQSTGPTYTYWPSGQLKRRTWQRGVYTDYTYTGAGEAYQVNYSDTTPDVTYTYDRRGRLTQVVDAVGTRTLSYNDLGQLRVEDFGTGILDAVRLENNYDSLFRRDWLEMKVSGVLRNRAAFGYESNTSRLKTVTKTPGSAADVAEYAYIPGSNLIHTLALRHDAGGGAVTVTNGERTYDDLDRLKSIAWTPQGGSTPELSYAYTYNNANQRTRVDLADGSHWAYLYDPMGQLISGKRSWANPVPPPNTVPVAGQQFEYSFDDIGNRTAAAMGGDDTGGNLRSVTYGPNLLNQYSQRQISSGADIMGYAPAGSTVTVNGQTAYRFAEFYQQLLTWANSAAARFEEVNILLNGNNFLKGSVFLPKTPEIFGYDADGNLLADGRWTYTWDGENRLIAMQTNSGLPTTLPIRRLEFAYDYLSRRIQKKVSQPISPPADTDGETLDSGTGGMTGEGDTDLGGGIAPYGWQVIGTTKFVWDRWNLFGELDGLDEMIRSYAWGLDLSGLDQGAGGIGGLLFQADAVGTVTHATYDGNGNLVRMRTTGGDIASDLEYGPFGEVTVARGDFLGTSPFRFSSKYSDAETGLLYFGHRYYNAGTGRWLSRDPAGEDAEPCLYAFGLNSPTDTIDPLGLLPHRAYYRAWATAKSFINVVGGNHGSAPRAFAVVTDKMFSENPLNETRNKGYRLYSAASFVFSCDCSDAITVNQVGLHKDAGKEGPLSAVVKWFRTSSEINGWVTEHWNRNNPRDTSDPPSWLVRVGRSSYAFSWGVTGRPHRFANFGMDMVASPAFTFRQSVWIWHTVSGRVYCEKGQGWIEATLDGSGFPSHRLWVQGKITETIPQGPLSDLWVSSPDTPWLVK